MLASDLTEEGVKRRIVRPYRHGTSIVQGGTIIPVASLRELRICMTSTAFEQAYSAEFAAHSRDMESLNREGGVFFASPGPGHDDMADSFDNVTERFLLGKEPGDAERGSLISSLSNHPIVSTIVGGVVLAGVVYYLGWK